MQGSLQAATRREKDVGQVFGKCGSSAGRLEGRDQLLRT